MDNTLNDDVWTIQEKMNQDNIFIKQDNLI
jgi:hypothetical protein